MIGTNESSQISLSGGSLAFSARGVVVQPFVRARIKLQESFIRAPGKGDKGEKGPQPDPAQNVLKLNKKAMVH